MSLRVLSLFAGIGGADLALEALGCTTVAHSDIEPYALDVFAKRFPQSRSLGSVTDITASEGEYDIIVGGFPCQDISNAGRRAGIEGERSGLWGEYARLIGEAKPRLVLIENVSALLRRGIDRVLWDLYQLGYACEWDCIPAAAVGAPHLRDRIWMVAYPDDLTTKTVFPGRRPKVLAALKDPIAKFPRAGKLEQGIVFACDPIAKRQTKRIEGRTYWNGVNLGDVQQPMWPTPRASWNENRATRRSPSAAAGSHGKKLAEEANEAEVQEGRVRGYLNPDWVEWLMGFPVGWTNLSVDEPVGFGWDVEPDIPRVAEGIGKRRQRLTACGNALVPQVMYWVAAHALEAVFTKEVTEA